MSEVKKFASLISFLSSVTGREFTTSDIDTIYDQVSNFKGEEIKSNFVDLTQLFLAMSEGRKIDAIKEYRELTRADLRNCKNAVESVMKN